jgi:hypothetical protein
MNEEDEAFNEIERRSKVKQTLVKAQLDKPKREWLGLTEDEIAECFKVTPDQYLTWHIYKRIEAKLKEKNT